MSMKKMLEQSLVNDNNNDSFSEVDSMVDEMLECGDSFPDPDRNIVDDIPGKSPLQTLKDIVKAVTENYFDFAANILLEDFDSAADKMVDNVVSNSNKEISDGEKERLKEKFKKNMEKMSSKSKE